MRHSPVLLLLVLCACSGAASTRGKGATSTGEADALGRWKTERGAYERAVGALGAGYLYQTHLAIGEAADLFGKGGLTVAEVGALMDTSLGMAANVLKILEELKTTDVSSSDHATVDRMIEVNRVISQQAEALKQFATEQTRENAERFARHRESAWVRLEALLRIRPK